MKRVAIIGDSNAMPREGAVYEHTWPYKLKQRFTDLEFLDFSRRASTSRRLVEEGGGYAGVKPGADLLEHYMPNMAIIQLGIVDCAPRLLNPNGIAFKVINNTGSKLKSIIYRELKKILKRDPSKVYVDIKDFSANFNSYLQRAQLISCKVIILLIAEPAHRFIVKNPPIKRNIAIYNQEIVRLSYLYDNCIVIKPFEVDDVENCLLDEFHYNWKGHAFVAERIGKVLNAIQ